MDETGAELAISEISSSETHNVDENDSEVVDNVKDGHRHSLVAGATEESKSIPPSDPQRVHSDVPPPSTAARTQSRRLATYIPNSQESSRMIRRTCSQTKALNESDVRHTFLSVESLKDKTILELARTENIRAACFVEAP